MQGRETLIRACGLREIVNGVGLLASADPRPWLWGRIAGDALDLSMLAVRACQPSASAPHRDAAMWMTTAIGGVDVACALLPDRARKGGAGARIDYSDRSGLPRSPEQMRGAARDSRYRATCGPRRHCGPTQHREAGRLVVRARRPKIVSPVCPVLGLAQRAEAVCAETLRLRRRIEPR